MGALAFLAGTLLSICILSFVSYSYGLSPEYGAVGATPRVSSASDTDWTTYLLVNKIFALNILLCVVTCSEVYHKLTNFLCGTVHSSIMLVVSWILWDSNYCFLMKSETKV